MSHIDPERLALSALGEPGLSEEESAHLDECSECLDELATLRHAADAGRASLDVGTLETPPESVWDRIAADLSLGSSAAPQSEAVPTARVGGRGRGTRLGWLLAASVVLVAGVGIGAAVFAQQSQPVDVAEGTLDALPAHPGARGTAIVEQSPDGSRRLRVELSADPTPDAFHEVWLLNADASALVSLGVIDQADQTFAIPADVDLATYSLVDVSAESVDGDPTHSGDSIVRGELSPT